MDVDKSEAREEDSPELPLPLGLLRLISAGAFASILVGTDLFLGFFCTEWSLFSYLLVAGFGAWRAERLYRGVSGDSFGSRCVRWVACALAIFSVVGFVRLSTVPVDWNTKCSWRYCARALGPGLFSAPYGSSEPTCRGWSVCANEYPYSPSEYSNLLKRVRAAGCPEP